MTHLLATVVQAQRGHPWRSISDTGCTSAGSREASKVGAMNRKLGYSVLLLVLCCTVCVASYAPAPHYAYQIPAQTGDGWVTASLDDVGMDEARCDLRLVGEHAQKSRTFEKVGMDPLDGHRLGEAADTHHLRPVDVGHPSGGDLVDEDVLPETLHSLELLV